MHSTHTRRHVRGRSSSYSSPSRTNSLPVFPTHHRPNRSALTNKSIPTVSRLPCSLYSSSSCCRPVYLSKSSIFQLPASLDPLDLPLPPSRLPFLPALRARLLDTISEVETSLVQRGSTALESSPDSALSPGCLSISSPEATGSTDSSYSLPSSLKLEEALKFMKDGFEVLERLTTDLWHDHSGTLMSELPFCFLHLDAWPEALFDEFKSKLPEIQDSVRSRFASVPLPGAVISRLPDFKDVSFDLDSLSSHLDLALLQSSSSSSLLSSSPSSASLFQLSSNLLPDPGQQLSHLKERLQHLRDRIMNLNYSNLAGHSAASLPPRLFLEDLLLVDSDSDDRDQRTTLGDQGNERHMGENKVEVMGEIQRALLESGHGTKLIEFEALPPRWKNNEFVRTGYRFIPFSSFWTLTFSVFRLHNETLNIHTHFIPFLMMLPFAIPIEPITNWLFGSFLPTSLNSDISPVSGVEIDAIPRYMFLIAAVTCLGCSTVWHTTAGCADKWVLEGGARIDYVGIGWLISASVASILYYAFECSPMCLTVYLTITILTGVAGTIAPFQAWFDERKNKGLRVIFFLAMVGVSVFLPFAHLYALEGFWRAFSFIQPVLRSLACYVLGLFFYASHFPESLLPGKLDWAGGGSHSLWHLCIILAIRAHWQCLEVLQSRATGGRSCVV